MFLTDDNDAAEIAADRKARPINPNFADRFSRKPIG